MRKSYGACERARERSPRNAAGACHKKAYCHAIRPLSMRTNPLSFDGHSLAFFNVFKSQLDKKGEHT